MRLTRDAILATRNNLKSEDVPVPEWGGMVAIREMTGRERDSWEQSLVGTKGSKVNIENVRARLVSRTAVDEHGKRLFSDEDAEELGQASGAGLERLAKVAQKLNMLSDVDLEEAKGN